MKIEDIKTTADLVKDVLEHVPNARNSDMLLYVKVCEKVNSEALNEPFWYVLMNLKDYNLPNMETVRRTRQKIQAEYPELAADSTVQGKRLLNEEVFRDFARGHV
jgi:hypothetical protein